MWRDPLSHTGRGNGLALKNPHWDLAGVFQWIERQPANQRVAGSIPSQGTYLGCGLGPQWGARERQSHTDVSLPLFLLLFSSLKINNLFKNVHWY